MNPYNDARLETFLSDLTASSYGVYPGIEISRDGGRWDVRALADGADVICEVSGDTLWAALSRVETFIEEWREDRTLSVREDNDRGRHV